MTTAEKSRAATDSLPRTDDPAARPLPGAAKLGPHHRERLALVYVRQLAPTRSVIIANPASASTPWPTTPRPWAGPDSASWSSTTTRDRAARGPPKHATAFNASSPR